MKDRQASPAAVHLFLLSALALFTEVVLIRWMAAEIRMFAYLKNFPLFAAFLGLGLGMLSRQTTRISRLWSWLISLLVLALALAPQLRLTRLFFPDAGIHQWGGNLLSPALLPAARAIPVLGAVLRGLPDSAVPWVLGAVALVVGFALFTCVVVIFYRFGELIGSRLKTVSPPLTAYSLNLLGSLAGTLTYVVWVFVALPPWVWILPIFVGIVYYSEQRWRDGLVLGTAFVVALTLGMNSHVLWSPYYRLDYTQSYGNGYTLSVDHDFHQDALDLRPQNVAKNPQLREAQKYYNFPYSVTRRCGRVLVVGAGTGNDVAAALRAGCTGVDAVEIDPVIAKLGSALHPEHPYDSQRVKVYVNDGRAFFHQARAAGKEYDLIVFGLVDSQTALSVVSSLRLEFLLYSVESFQEALSLLDRKDGLLVVGFSVGWKDWIARRLYKTLERAAGWQPLALQASHYVDVLTLVAGPRLPEVRQSVASLPEVKDLTQDLAGTPINLVRDDWPYLYHNPQALPLVYLASLILVMALGWLLVRRAIAEGDSGPGGGLDWPMFFMGSAFLLVETKNISQLAILFGSTWITNSVVFTSVFVMALLANLWIARRPFAKLTTLYGLLGIALMLSYVTPFSTLTKLSPISRGAIGGFVTALPVLFSGLIFAQMFSEARFADAALGSNILGGLFGGAIEAASIFTGVRAMALIAIALYGAAWLFWIARRRRAVATAVA